MPGQRELALLQILSVSSRDSIWEFEQAMETAAIATMRIRYDIREQTPINTELADFEKRAISAES